MAQYFYDEQTKKWMLQFAKIFADWKVTFGNDPQGNPILHRVPIQYGDLSRQVATVINNNSPSNLPAVPLISYYISGYEFDQKRTQDPTFIDTLAVRQRTLNPDTNQYEQTQGQAFTVKRLMPVPYTLRFNVDIWTSNYKQKLEILEQLGVLFNPSLELQSNPNIIDWTSLSVVYQDGLTFTSRTIPQGTGNPIDIMSWKFYTPIWLSTPIKVEKLGIIQKVIASVFKGDALTDMKDDDLLLGTRQKITPYGYKLLLTSGAGVIGTGAEDITGASLQILPSNQTFIPGNNQVASIASVLITEIDPTDTFTFYTTDVCKDLVVGQEVNFDGIVGYPIVTAIQSVGTGVNSKTAITLSVAQTFTVNTQVDFDLNPNPITNKYWRAVLGVYGTVRPGISMITLENPELPTEIMGTIEFNPGDDRLLKYTIDVDTLPADSLDPINSVIDPHAKWPESVMNVGVGGLPPAVTGQRYLIVTDLGDTPAWGQLYQTVNGVKTAVDQAYANDIIEYDGTDWVISFDSGRATAAQFVTNMNTGVQYRWAIAKAAPVDANGITIPGTVATPAQWAKSWEGFYEAGDWNIVI